MTVSIIIAAKRWQKNLEECVRKCGKLDYPDFEIIVLPDVYKPDDAPGLPLTLGMRIIPTGALSPPHKRDIGIAHARGDIIAFIDDDAYPRHDWLAQACAEFKDGDTAAVAGPALTPPEDSLRQKASGALFALWLVSGHVTYRYIPKPRRQVRDYPTCNLFVRASVLKEIGGFNTNFWPGEDTLLCLEITEHLHKKIIYSPAVIVYHHRRPLFLPHLRQVVNYALHRGYFVKRFPQTSRLSLYFVPSIFVTGLLTLGFLSAVSQEARLWLVVFGAVYINALLIATMYSVRFLSLTRQRLFDKALFMLMVFAGIILTHCVYGVSFIKGLVSPALREEQ